MNSTENTYREVHFEQIVPVYIPSHLLEKIKYLCKKINKVEWSGVLFYRTSGKFGSKHFKCILEDILLMNIGDAHSFEFYFTEGITPYLHKNQQLRGTLLGLIHSHHNMQVFFSQDDMNELHNNAGNHNYYLSVIVNNHNEIIAKVCFLATRKHLVSTTLDLLGDGGQPMQIGTESIDETDQVLGIYDCQIHHYNSAVSNEFEDRYREMVSKNKPTQSSSPKGSPTSKKGKVNPKQGTIFSAIPAAKSRTKVGEKKKAVKPKKKTN